MVKPERRRVSIGRIVFLLGSILAVTTWIAWPQPHRCHGPTNEGRAVSSLRVLFAVSEQFRSRFGHYPGARSGNGLTDLANEDLRPAPYIDAQLGTGQKSGFRFEYHGAVNRWSCTATPIRRAIGDRSFFIDQSGTMRIEPRYHENGPATALHPELD